MNKENPVYIPNKILFSLKEWNSIIWGNMGIIGDPYVKWNKQDIARQILYDLTSISNVKKG